MNVNDEKFSLRTRQRIVYTKVVQLIIFIWKNCCWWLLRLLHYIYVLYHCAIFYASNISRSIDNFTVHILTVPWIQCTQNHSSHFTWTNQHLFIILFSRIIRAYTQTIVVTIKTDRISNVCLIFLVLTMKIKYSLRKRTRTAVLVTMSRSFLFVRFCYFCHDSHSHSEPMWFHCSKCTAFWYVFIYKDDSVTFKFCIC